MCGPSPSTAGPICLSELQASNRAGTLLTISLTSHWGIHAAPSQEPPASPKPLCLPHVGAHPAWACPLQPLKRAVCWCVGPFLSSACCLNPGQTHSRSPWLSHTLSSKVMYTINRRHKSRFLSSSLPKLITTPRAFVPSWQIMLTLLVWISIFWLMNPNSI